MPVSKPGRAHYSQQLQEIRDEILLSGSIVARSIERAVTALKQRDIELARAIIADDQVIDERQYELEDRILTIIATQHPMAGDLRGLAGALFIVGELERMGDYAEGIANIAIAVADQSPLSH